MRFTRYVCAMLALALVQAASLGVSSPEAASPDVVISQIYGAGGNNGAVLTHDYIELYNRGTVPVPLDGWSLQYASGTGTGNFGANSGQLTELTGVIAPGRYLLIQEAGGTNGVPLPSADIIDPTPISMAAAAGKVALVRQPTSLGCNGGSTPCSEAQNALIVDLVGYGGANFFEGAGPAPSPSTTAAVFRQDGGALDNDQNRTDFELAPPAPRSSGVNGLSIADVSVAEGDDVNPVATFRIKLNTEATDPVTFTVQAKDVTAQAGLDYVAPVATQLEIPVGQREVTFDVTILADVVPEPDEEFAVALSNVSGTVASRDVAVGRILTDDFPEFGIHELQGNGDVSLHLNETVATRGVVTGVKSNGFFIQTPDAETDDDPQTSEGIFVFTGSTAPPTVVLGDSVRVTGRVVEFRGSSATRPGTLTEMDRIVAVRTRSTGNALPASVDMASIPTDVPSRSAQLERYESMLVHAASLVVVAPTNGFGEFYGVLPGIARPFREPGIDVEDTLPHDAPPGIARFDGNPERIMVDSDEGLLADGSRRAALQVSTGATVTSVFGPLDYAFDEYRIALDGIRPVETAGGMTPRPLATGRASELTIVSLNVLNFWQVGSTPDAEAAFAARVERAARTIVEDLRTPDILGLIEVGDLAGLRQLGTRVNELAGTSYEGYLIESDDDTPDDQDVGYLVNAARVEVIGEPRPLRRGDTFTLCGVTDVVFDRPPFVLEARFDGMPVTVILNHLRSLIDINSTEAFRPGDCTETLGSRVREKRRIAAEWLADEIETRKDQNLIVMGDMNAFELNDGYSDIVGTLEGTPAPVNEVVEPIADRWSFTMQSLARVAAPADRYSYVHEGNAQVLDHILVNEAMRARLTASGFARINADFPASVRLSDHDAAFARFAPIASLTTTTSLPETIVAGTGFSYEVTVTNAGADRADQVTVSATLPQGAAYNSVTSPAGWSCAVSSGTVTCTAPSLAAGASAMFVVHAALQCELGDGAVLTAHSSATSLDDAQNDDNASSDSVTVTNPAPVISGAAVDMAALWPADHKMKNVRVFYSTTDNCGPVNTVLAVSSNEPVSGTGGDTAPDWEVVDGNTVRLRAERAGTGSGRVYTITITAADSVGNASAQTVRVAVPHNR